MNIDGKDILSHGALSTNKDLDATNNNILNDSIDHSSI